MTNSTSNWSLCAGRTSPFDKAPKLPREAVFVEPELVAEIELREWTAERIMRAPSFKGLREDKAPREVRIEVVGEDAPRKRRRWRRRGRTSIRVGGTEMPPRRCSTRSTEGPRARCS